MLDLRLGTVGTILTYAVTSSVAAMIVLCVVICFVVAMYRRKKRKRRSERFSGTNRMHSMSGNTRVTGKRVDSDLSMWSSNGVPMTKSGNDLWCVTGVGSQDFSSLDHVDLIIDDEATDRVSLASAYPDLEFAEEHTERGHATMNSRT